MLKKFSFQTKFFIYCSLVVIALISLSFISFYLYTSNDLEGRAIETLNQLTQKTSEQIDSMWVEMDKIAIHTLSNPNVLNILSRAKEKKYVDNYFDTELSETMELSKTLLSIAGASMPVARISIFNDREDYIQYGIYPQRSSVVHSFFRTETFKENYQKILSQPGKRLISEPHKDYWTGSEEIKLLSLFREIKNLDTYESYGIIEVQQPYSKLEGICNIKNSDDLKVYLVLESTSIAYPMTGSKDLESEKVTKYYLNQIGSKKEGHLKVVNPVSNNTELLTFKNSAFSNGTLIMVKEEKSILKPINVFGAIMLITGVVLIILTLTIIFIITNHMTKPLKDLRKSLKTVSLDNLSVEINHNGIRNELIRLNEAFDAMFRRLKESMEQIMQYRSQEAKAHVLALQSQMDPHFLYNVLSIISAIAYEKGVAKIADISSRLSQMLRYTTSFQDKGTIIENEIQHTIHYLELMKERYEERLNYTISKDDKALKISVPKLILQPLVENCFQHGFKDQEPPWVINITIGSSMDAWFMEVYDNGSGFDKSVLSGIQLKAEEFLKNPSSNIKEMQIGGLALLNTYIRLKLLYPDKFLFKVESNAGQGTKVTIGGNIL